MGNEELCKVLVNHIADDYDIIVDAKKYGSTAMLDIAVAKLLTDITLYCKVCNHIPRNITDMEMRDVLSGKLSASYGKRLLSDPVVTLGLLNVFRPIDVGDVFRIAYDSHYVFVPLENRPADDFMNKPVCEE